MAATKKKLLIVADDHPHVRKALEYLLTQLHDSTTFYTADNTRELLSLANRRLAEADTLTVADIVVQDTDPAADAPPAAGDTAPLMVISLQEQGITANWFVSIEDAANPDGDQTRIENALDQRSIVMELIRSLNAASGDPGTTDPAAPTAPSTDSLMRLGLTQRQAEVLLWLADGLTNKEIARKLNVSEWTVRHHVSAILERLEVSNRGRAAMFARQLGAG